MISTHNKDYSRVITRSSVHNVRIQRLWRDFHQCVVLPFYDTFRSLQGDGTLYPVNEVDLYCLHYVFLPRILKILSQFGTFIHCLVKVAESHTNYSLMN